MKKIAVITTGGTIGSIPGPDSVAVESGAQQIIREIELAADRLACSVVIDSPLTENSENFEPEDWGIILAAIARACDSGVDGVVVTHGTDTLPFTVAAALAFANLWTVKVCFTGSFHAPDHPQSDASLNLLAALDFVLSPQPESGVYLAFRADAQNSRACILSGASIKPMLFDDLRFEAAYPDTPAQFSPATGRKDEALLAVADSLCLGRERVPDAVEINRAKGKVGYLRMYPGIDRKMLAAAAMDRDVLVMELYHSGTGPAGAGSELLKFLHDVLPDTGVLMGTFPGEYIDLPYDSTVNIKKTGARIYRDLQTHFLYVFAVLGLAAGMSVDDITGRLAEFEVQDSCQASRCNSPTHSV